MKKMVNFMTWVLAIVSITSCASSKNLSTSNSAPEKKHESVIEEKAPKQDKFKEYTFQAGDVFDVKFIEYPEFDQTIIVRPDGRISLPFLKEFSVVGVSPSVLDAMITERYREKIKNPEVAIILKEFAGQIVYIGGEVNKPGVIQLTSRMTLLQAIFHAGGFKRSAKLDSVILVRNNNNAPEVRQLDIEKMLYEGSLDLLLQPSDVVFLPKTFVTVAGDFIDQYINQLIPSSARLNFQYLLNPYNDRYR